ncbi:hypothetical protein EVAR_71296_1 [Eumeta japonica]|uniref:Uncharacterized protein n=1 Tax=Eumeta variegata TaxID=151549 RepID=A0A4C2AHJ5_EUMVA|nr:hypothetical protein EVAR_71296_1 [Eumeta japonica]
MFPPEAGLVLVMCNTLIFCFRLYRLGGKAPVGRQVFQKKAYAPLVRLLFDPYPKTVLRVTERQMLASSRPDVCLSAASRWLDILSLWKARSRVRQLARAYL